MTAILQNLAGVPLVQRVRESSPTDAHPMPARFARALYILEYLHFFFFLVSYTLYIDIVPKKFTNLQFSNLKVRLTSHWWGGGMRKAFQSSENRLTRFKKMTIIAEKLRD